MKKKSWIGCVAVFFLASSTLASAQTLYPRYKKAKRKPLVEEQVTPPEHPWYVFLGGDLGYSHYSAYNNSTTEAPRGGFDGGFRGLLAHYWHDWVVDGGLGIQWISNKGTNADGSTNKDNTTNAYVDLSPRYRFGRDGDVNWQFGPEFQYWLNTDKGLNPTPIGSNVISDGSNTSIWAGLQVLREWGESTKFRIGARGLTALNVSNRSVYVGQIFFQVGFDVFHSSEDTIVYDRGNVERVNQDDLDRVESAGPSAPLEMATPYPIPEATPWPSPEQAAVTPEPLPELMSTPAPVEVEPLPEPVVETKQPPKVILTLDVNDLPFGFNSSALPKANAARVRRIGEFLRRNNGTWKGLSVGGYTDERGSKKYNANLSKRRAAAVRKLLVEGGADGSKIKTIGYGAAHPRDPGHTEKAWAKNRRVELEFKGVKDVVLMKKAMTE